MVGQYSLRLLIAGKGLVQDGASPHLTHWMQLLLLPSPPLLQLGRIAKTVPQAKAAPSPASRKERRRF